MLGTLRGMADGVLQEDLEHLKPNMVLETVKG